GIASPGAATHRSARAPTLAPPRFRLDTVCDGAARPCPSPPWFRWRRPFLPNRRASPEAQKRRRRTIVARAICRSARGRRARLGARRLRAAEVRERALDERLLLELVR